MSLSNPPPSLKPVSHYLKVALEHDNRDKVIAYWARFAAVQKSLTIDKTTPDAKTFVITLLEWLEKSKKELSTNESITVESAGEAHIENYALKLFNWADKCDRDGVFNKNVVKAFYTSGILFDILESLHPPISEEFGSARKYAKWKAAYIHNCLKSGETPVSGGGVVDGDDNEEEGEEHGGVTQSYGFVKPGDKSGSAYAPGDGGSGGIESTTNQFDNFNLYGYDQQASGGGTGAQPGNYYGHDNVPAPQVPVPYADPNIVMGINSESGATTTTTTPCNLSVEQIAKAQKYCKWAGSALNFDDVGSAIENLEKALRVLKTGQD